MSILRQGLRTALSLGMPRRWLLTSGPAASSSVCLTFDDGPDPDHTPHLLDVLRDRNVTATFFVIGEKAEKHPELIRRIAAEGHAIGQHSYSHGDPLKTSARELLAEVTRTTAVLQKILGRPCPLFRPPKGHLNTAKLLGLRRAGLTIVLWNVDPRDYRAASADAVQQYFREHPLKAGDIVLLHDVKPHAAEVIPHIAQSVRAAGLHFTHPLAWNRQQTAANVAAL